MTRYQMNISISVFGDYGYPIDSMISEFKNFVSNNSLIDLNINVGKYGQLQDSEFGQPDPTWGYFVYPGNLLPSTKQKIPSNVQINILMYDWKNKETGYGGGTLGGDSGIYQNVPYIGIPLGPNPNFEANPWGPWSTVIAQRLTHEWMHALKWILDNLYNLTGFPNADGVCEQYGYNDQNDPGWYRCYQFFLSTKITTEMYQAIENNNYKPTVTPTITPPPTVKTNFWIAIDKGKTEIRRKSDNILLAIVDSNYIKTLQLTIGTEYKLQSFPDSGYTFDKYCKYNNDILLECMTANPAYFIPQSGITEYNFRIYFKTTVTPTTTPTTTPTVTPTTTPIVTPTITPTIKPTVTPTVTPITPITPGGDNIGMIILGGLVVGAVIIYCVQLAQLASKKVIT